MLERCSVMFESFHKENIYKALLYPSQSQTLFKWGLWSQTDLNLNSSFISYSIYNWEHVAFPLWASDFSSVIWGRLGICIFARLTYKALEVFFGKGTVHAPLVYTVWGGQIHPLQLWPHDWGPSWAGNTPRASVIGSGKNMWLHLTPKSHCVIFPGTARAASLP